MLYKRALTDTREAQSLQGDCLSFRTAATKKLCNVGYSMDIVVLGIFLSVVVLSGVDAN